MNQNECKELLCKLNSLAIFRDIIYQDQMNKFIEYLNALNEEYLNEKYYNFEICDKADNNINSQKNDLNNKSDNSSDKYVDNNIEIRNYESNISNIAYFFGEFVYSLANYDYSFSKYLKQAVCESENYYIKRIAKKKDVSDLIKNNVKEELKLFSKISEISVENLSPDGLNCCLKFENSKIDFEKLYEERVKNIDKYGYGIFTSSVMFKLTDESEIIPVEAPDKHITNSFIGYDSERQKIIDNTKALIQGRPAQNALLFGDAGTGKSSTVKAVANYFYEDGIRLIELRKNQLFFLSSVMGKIADNPLKFIIFIDDLSFNNNDDSFSMLKAALEGSASAKAENAVIYATSNRRHIIKESFADREDDDIHRNDTMQELMSLSDRFGLKVYFEKPTKELYLEIVKKLAKKNNIKISKLELESGAERFALSIGGRTPRAAEQYIASLM